MNTDLLQLKPQVCRVDCGGQVPPPSETMPNAKMTYRCGLSIFGSCPAVKSLTRARQKRRRHLRGLWRRSRRHLRQHIEAMAILTEYPETENRIPEGAAARIRARAAEADYDAGLYQRVRQTLPLQEAVDEYLSVKRPFTPKA